MQLTMTTDYALRCMLYLAGKEGLSSSTEIGEAVGLNKIFVQKFCAFCVTLDWLRVHMA